MKKGLLAGILGLAATLLAAAPAAAESPRDMMLEIKFGPFRPSIDSEFGGSGPYSKVFGSGQVLLTRLEFDYEFFKKFGVIAVGGSIGFAKDSGKGLLATGEKSNDTTTFYLFPMTLDLIYRFDWLAQKYNVPLVPSVKAGFDYYIWWITNGTGKIPQYKDPVTGKVSQGRGGTFGGHVTFGLAFLMDWLAPDMAQTFDTDMGVNNTYLFAEFTMAWINDFKAKKSLDLSSKTFLFGLGFEF